ncbi:putative ribonuclease H-like domain-containing protein [Tanacetum coccineum]
MTGNKCYLTEYEDYDGGFVSFGDGKGRISEKGKIKTGTLDFDNVYFCKELKYNLFSVSQIYDKKNNVLFTDTECLVLSSDFKLLDESQVLLKFPRKETLQCYLKSVVLTKGLTCLFAKATIDESNLWHRRLGHINFKNINKLVKGNLVRGLPSKIFENNHSCVACQKGKQYKASCKAKLNGVAERRNRTLIEAARTMDHLGKFGGKADEGFLLVKTTSTPMEPNKALVKDEEADSVDVHLYRSMIGSLMYLTASRPDITFAVCACARFQVTPKTSHLHVVKRIFRYLKGQPKLGLWYPRDSPFDLEAFLDSDYAGASLDRKSTTGVFHSETKHIRELVTIYQDSYEKTYSSFHGFREVFKDGFDGCIGLKMLFGSVLRVKHGKKLVLPGLLYPGWQKLVLSGIELVLPGKLSTAGLPLEEVLLGTEENADFHQILDFLTSSSINFALTVSPTIYASYIEQFWNTACLKTINSEKKIHANVDGKVVVVLESSVRRDLHLNDEDVLSSQVTTAAASQPPKDSNTYRRTKRGQNTKVPQSGGSPNKVVVPGAKKPWGVNGVKTARQTAVSTVKGTGVTVVMTSGNPQQALKNKGLFDSGCSRHMTGNKDFLTDYQDIDGAHIEQLLPSPTTYQRKRKTQTRRRTKKDTKLPQTSVPQDLEADKAVHKEGGDSVERAITTAASLDATKDSDNIIRTQTTTMPNVYIPQGMDTSGSHRRQDTIGGAPAQTRMEHKFKLTANVPITLHDSPLPGGYTPGSDEGRLKLQELITMCTKWSKQVLDLEKEKDVQAVEILSLKKRDKANVMKLLKWILHENYGVHTLFMDGTPMEINMLVEKKYPLIKELLEKMLNLQLEAEEESTMAFELIKFIKSMLEE